MTESSQSSIAAVAKPKMSIKKIAESFGWIILFSGVFSALVFFLEKSSRTQALDVIYARETETTNRLNELEDRLQGDRMKWLEEVRRLNPDLKLPPFKTLKRFDPPESPK